MKATQIINTYCALILIYYILASIIISLWLKIAFQTSLLILSLHARGYQAQAI